MTAPSRKLIERWSDRVGDRFVAVPVALLRHASALGLDDGDVRLLLALESFRFGAADEPVFAAQKTLAALCGCSVSQIERRVARLKKRGLIEVERRRRPDGRRLNHYTRHGLLDGLECLTAAESDPAPTRGSGEGMPASTRGSDPAPVRAPNPASVRAEEEDAKNARATAATVEAVLAEFNARAGTAYGLDSREARHVADRVGEHPELSASDYRRILDGAFANPWWSGPPGTAVVFKPEQFEKALQHLRASRGRAVARRGVDPVKQQRVDRFMQVLASVEGAAQRDTVVVASGPALERAERGAAT